jgi:hypothetical protein
LYLFNRYSKDVFPESIGQNEAYWLEQSTISAMMFAESYEGEGYDYDIVSMYPSILQSKYFLIPVKTGEFKKLDQLQNILTFGIYRCKIEQLVNKKRFKYNPTNYYTHIEINRARNLNLQIELIQDDQPNALVYSRDKLVNSHLIFGKYINILFKLKQEGVTRAKSIINILWGLLSEYKVKRQVIKNDETIVIPPAEYIREITPYGDEDTCTFIKTINSKRIYKYNYARMATFLLSKGRELIMKHADSIIDDVVYLHTDGIITKHKHTFTNMGDNIGQMKYKGYCANVKIDNCTSKSGKFKL